MRLLPTVEKPGDGGASVVGVTLLTLKPRLRRSRDRVSWNPTLAAKYAARAPGHAKALI
jgi:hypothetical protein